MYNSFFSSQVMSIMKYFLLHRRTHAHLVLSKGYWFHHLNIPYLPPFSNFSGLIWNLIISCLGYGHSLLIRLQIFFIFTLRFISTQPSECKADYATFLLKENFRLQLAQNQIQLLSKLKEPSSWSIDILQWNFNSFLANKQISWTTYLFVFSSKCLYMAELFHWACYSFSKELSICQKITYA